MKHYSPSALERGAAPLHLLTDNDLKARMREQLDGTSATKRKLAGRLGTTEGALSRLLRSDLPVPPEVAALMGFRRTVRFEAID